MSLSKRLLSLKASQLKHAAFLIGAPSTGTKTELESVLRSRLLPPSPNDGNASIVSVDMGIKNLGICVLEPSMPLHATTNPAVRGTRVKIHEWKRMNLITLSLASNQNPASLFTPSLLSPLAVQLAQHLVSMHTPQHILIERQRFRSAGASAVQEWTLRVNMLESMLWAALESMRSQSQRTSALPFPTTWEMNPARVAGFWCGGDSASPAENIVSDDLFSISDAGKAAFKTGPDEGLSPPHPSSSVGKRRKKVEKKDKIAVVRSWLNPSSADPAANSNLSTSISLDFSDQAREVADTFLPANRGRGKEGGKLDDLADCLLQGVAWIKWKQNEGRMRELLQQEIEADDSARVVVRKNGE